MKKYVFVCVFWSIMYSVCLLFRPFTTHFFPDLWTLDLQLLSYFVLPMAMVLHMLHLTLKYRSSTDSKLQAILMMISALTGLAVALVLYFWLLNS